MKKLFILMQLALAAAAYSSYASADHGHHHGHHGHHDYDYYDHPRHHRHHHDHYRPVYHEEVIYYAPPPVVHYYPQPQVSYYPAPQPSYDQRSGSGLVGGMLGSAFGYEIGRGDPIAAGLGAAAGSYMGNRY